MSHTGLLAVRTSFGSFESVFNVRSPEIDAAIDEANSIGQRAAALSLQIVAELYESLPRAENAQARRLILRAKRDAYGGRPVAAECLPVIGDAGTLERIEQYNELLELKARTIARSTGAGMRQLRKRLAEMARNPEFSTALDYSCPWLLPRYLRDSCGTETEFTHAERGLYAYAARFFSKANPFHTFASITVPYQNRNIEGEEFCEVVLDTSVITSLESARLGEGVEDARRYLYFRAHIEEQGCVHFFVPDGHAGRLVVVRNSPLLARALTFCACSAPARTLAECAEELASAFADLGSARASSYLRGLIREGVLVEYLVRDFDDFAGDLAGGEPELAATVPALQRIHLARVATRELPAIHERLSAFRKFDSGEPSYFVNLYKQRKIDAEQRLSNAILPDLTLLKPFFSACHNYSERAFIVRRFLIDQALGRPGEVLFLAALRAFLRGPSKVVEKYSRENAAELPGRSPAALAWRRKLQEHSGILSADELRALLHTPLPDEPPRPLCFNGPIDYEAGTFFPTNVFAGGGRVLSRYLLENRKPPDSARRVAGSPVDVQLIGPFKGNRTYVRSIFPTGCGFDARYRHRFQDWIDPSEIVVRFDGQRLLYVHGPSGTELQFHFCGFVMAEFLGPEYQLLLAGHADTFQNPFAREASALSASDADIRRIAPLYFSKICLRREEWIIPAGKLAPAMENRDIVKATFALREWIQGCTGEHRDHWYYGAGSGHGLPVKPRYLNLRNPLSVQLLRRDVRRLEKKGSIGLTPMDPGVDALFHQNGETFVTEVMIEV